MSAEVFPSPVSAGTSLPLVSVIMPAYNAELYISEAIKSVLTQDYPNLELIVVDDGSQDGTATVASSFGGCVRVFQQTNGGPSVARNFGLSVAKGDFIAFLDADDIWRPGKLTAQVNCMQANPSIGVVFGKFMRWYPRSDGTFAPPPLPADDSDDGDFVQQHSGWIYCELLYDNIITIIAAMIRRSVLDAVGNFDEELTTGEDYDFWLRVSRCFPAAKLNRTLAYYRMHSLSTTHIPRKENNEYRVLCKALEQYGSRGPDGSQADDHRLQERLYRLCFNHGYLHYWQGDAAIARAAFWNAIHYAKLEPRAWIYLLLAAVRMWFGIKVKR